MFLEAILIGAPSAVVTCRYGAKNDACFKRKLQASFKQASFITVIVESAAFCFFLTSSTSEVLADFSLPAADDYRLLASAPG